MRTFKEIKDELGVRRSTFSSMHEEMRRDEVFLNATSVWQSGDLEQYVSSIPAGKRLQVPPTAIDAVNIQLNQVMVGETAGISVLLPPGVHRDPRRMQQAKEDLEKKLQALAWAIDTSRTESPLRQFMFDSLGLGLGVISHATAWDRWKPEPFVGKDGVRRKPRNAHERSVYRQWELSRQRTIPWDVKAIPPRRCFFDPWHDPPEDVIVEEQVSVRAYAARYPQLGQHWGADKKGTLLTFCSMDEYGLWLDDIPLLKKKDGAQPDGVAENTSGVMWYKFAWSGFGHQSHDGNWVHRGKGVLRDARDVIAMYIAAINQLEVIRSVYAFPPLEGIGPTQAQAEQEMRGMAWGPGQQFAHSDAVRIAVMQMPQVPQAVFQSIQSHQQLLEIHFGPEILRGVVSAGETLGGQASRLAQAKAPLRTAQNSGEQAFAALLMDICHTISEEANRIGPLVLPDRVGDIVELGPDDMIPGMRILVDFAPPGRDDKVRQEVERYDKLRLKIMSRRTVMASDAEIDNVDEELAEIDSDALMETPGVQELLGRAAGEQVQRELEAAGQLAPPAPPAPAPPAPPAPGAAPSVSGPQANGAGQIEEPYGPVPVA